MKSRTSFTIRILVSVMLLLGVFAFQMRASAAAYPVTHAVLSSTGDIRFHMGSSADQDVNLCLSDMKNLQADMEAHATYVADNYSTYSTSLTNKTNTVANGKTTIANKITGRGVSMSKTNGYYTWNTLAAGVGSVYEKGRTDGRSVVARTIASKGIYISQGSGSANQDWPYYKHEEWHNVVKFTNTYGCKCVVEAGGSCDVDGGASLRIYNASGTHVQTISGSGKSVSWKGILEKGYAIQLYLEGVHGSKDRDASYSIIALPLGFN